MKRIALLASLVAIVSLTVIPALAEGPGCVSSGVISSSQVVWASGAGHQFVSALILTDGSNAATVTAYDNATGAGGKVIFKGTVSGPSNFGGGDAGAPVNLSHGIYVEISGTGASAVVYYR